MLKRLIVAALAIGIVAVGDVPTVEAQQSSKQHSLANGATLSQLRDAIARMTDLHVRNLASTIAALLAQKAKNDPALEEVVVFHIEFLKRGAWFAKTLDTMEFRKGQDGSFTHHRT